MFGEDAHLEQEYEDRYTTLADFDQEDPEDDDYDEEDVEEYEDDEEDDDTDLAPAGYQGRHRAGIL